MGLWCRSERTPRPPPGAASLGDLTAQDQGGLTARIVFSMGRSQGTDGIAARFLEAAAASPDAIALSSPSEDWSYTKLLRRSGGVAIALGDLGVGPGDRVGIASGRGFGRIVGMLGTALAGAAFVPIDPKQPRSRI